MQMVEFQDLVLDPDPDLDLDTENMEQSAIHW